jgi:hypothetical protein
VVSVSRIDFAPAGEWWASGARPHKVDCHCASDGYHCEHAQAVAEEAAERREMSGLSQPPYSYDEEAGW